MRAITVKAAKALTNGYDFSLSNTRVAGRAMYLHGNKIAEYRHGRLCICDGGWQTLTTKERLNGLPGVNVYQRRGQWYLNGKQWGGEWTRV